MTDQTHTSPGVPCDEPDCAETIRELDVFLDDEMTPELRASIHHHLECCPDCEHAFHFHVELKAVIRQKCLDEEMPSGLLSRIEQCFDADLGSDLAAD